MLISRIKSQLSLADRKAPAGKPNFSRQVTKFIALSQLNGRALLFTIFCDMCLLQKFAKFGEWRQSVREGRVEHDRQGYLHSIMARLGDAL